MNASLKKKLFTFTGGGRVLGRMGIPIDLLQRRFDLRGLRFIINVHRRGGLREDADSALRDRRVNRTAGCRVSRMYRSNSECRWTGELLLFRGQRPVKGSECFRQLTCVLIKELRSENARQFNQIVLCCG